MDARLTTAQASLTRAVASPRVAPFLRVAALAGYLISFLALAGRGVVTQGGEGGGDAFAYWTAGHAVLEGTPLYGTAVGGYAAYLYPPIFAQIVAPFSLLPLTAFLWLWRGLELLCLRLVMGSWRATGIALIAWLPVLSELDAANVHLIIAAAVALAVRGDGRALVPAALTKFASLAALPAAWRSDRSGVVWGAGLALGACLISALYAPGAWADYLAFLPHATEPSVGWFNLGSLIATPLRLAFALALALAAWRWRRLAVVAVTLAMPVLWFHSLSTLVALVARPRDDR